MSADHFADKDGNFELLVSVYSDSRTVGSVRITGLKPFEPLQVEMTAGSDYYPSEAPK